MDQVINRVFNLIHSPILISNSSNIFLQNKGKITIIGCPKLDGIDYSEKLTAILAENNIREVVIVRMEVPCCGGLQRAAENAIKTSGKFIPWHVVTISRDGKILE